MQQFVFFFVLAVATVGCSSMQSRRETALAIWRSPSSDLNRRAEAIEILIPRGAQAEEIENVLGSQLHWDHWQIAQYDFSHGIRFPDKDYDTVDYEFADGKVSLVFGPNSKLDGFWFASARFCQNLKNNEAP